VRAIRGLPKTAYCYFEIATKKLQQTITISNTDFSNSSIEFLKKGGAGYKISLT
jgi:hypothetical protein